MGRSAGRRTCRHCGPRHTQRDRAGGPRAAAARRCALRHHHLLQSRSRILRGQLRVVRDAAADQRRRRGHGQPRPSQYVPPVLLQRRRDRGAVPAGGMPDERGGAGQRRCGRNLQRHVVRQRGHDFLRKLRRRAVPVRVRPDQWRIRHGALPAGHPRRGTLPGVLLDAPRDGSRASVVPHPAQWRDKRGARQPPAGRIRLDLAGHLSLRERNERLGRNLQLRAGRLQSGEPRRHRGRHPVRQRHGRHQPRLRGVRLRPRARVRPVLDPERGRAGHVVHPLRSRGVRRQGRQHRRACAHGALHERRDGRRVLGPAVPRIPFQRRRRGGRARRDGSLQHGQQRGETGAAASLRPRGQRRTRPGHGVGRQRRPLQRRLDGQLVRHLRLGVRRNFRRLQQQHEQHDHRGRFSRQRR
ncbi:MAG: hypothetical protein BWY59_00344 [Verrucomicrobia bacterium ADurb.Bin345]|nr:MAG: hypothetical protein BWY59_00344 [Verrucomicrobia bacterium ADurb.Bin345]